MHVLLFSREELLQRLTVITEVLLGAGVALPMWKGEPISMFVTLLSSKSVLVILAYKATTVIS